MPLLILLILPVIVLFVWVVINCFIMISGHYQATDEINQFKHFSKKDPCLVFENIKCRFIHSTGYKSYINLINGTDVYLFNEYMIVMPFQTFPFKAYHQPILLGKNVNQHRQLGANRCYKPDKIVFKEVLKGEIEITWHINSGKYQIRLQGLSKDKKQQFEGIKEWV